MSIFRTEPSSLGQLAELAIEHRYAYVHREGRAELDAAIHRLRYEAPHVHRAVTIERLGWAVAFNVCGPAPSGQGRAHEIKRSYLDYWRPETPWSTVWSRFVAPLNAAGDRPTWTVLLELATSIACEHRDDWQPMSARPVNSDHAGVAFTTLLDAEKKKITGFVFNKFRQRAGPPQDIADEAWTRVFLGYWSQSAHKRVLGMSAISNLVCGAAYRIGCDVLRQQRASSSDDTLLALSHGSEGGKRPAGEEPGDRLAAAELEQHMRICREELPGRQQVAARMVWDLEMPQVEVARQLGVSPPAISQLLAKARTAMHKCLKDKGLV